MITTRLVQSACAIVADQFGYSANMERLMQAQNQGAPNRDGQMHMHEWARKQRALEINPRSPLIEGLLRKITTLQDVEEGEELDAELDREVKEISGILIDGALVRSGFDVPDSNEYVPSMVNAPLYFHGLSNIASLALRFFERIDRVLRRAVGVSESAPTDTTVEPAPEAENTEPVGDETTKKLASELDHDVVVDEHLFDGPVDLPAGVTMGRDGIPEIRMGGDGIPDVVMDENIDVKVTRDEL